MLDTPLDATYVWLGLAAVGLALTAVAVGLPTAPPPDANRAAGVIDSVAAAEPPARATHATVAGAVRLTPRTVAVRNERATSRARLAFGPVVPVVDGRLARIARGAPPPTVFGDRRAFRRAVQTAEAGWQHGSNVHIAHVSWGTDVTLVTVE